MMLMMINRVNNKFCGISTDLFDEIHLFTNFSGDRKNENEIQIGFTCEKRDIACFGFTSFTLKRYPKTLSS